MPLQALLLNCTLKATGREKSSTDRLLGEVMEELRKHDCEGEIVRVADRANIMHKLDVKNTIEPPISLSNTVASEPPALTVGSSPPAEAAAASASSSEIAAAASEPDYTVAHSSSSYKADSAGNA